MLLWTLEPKCLCTDVLSSILLGLHLGVELLGHMVTLYVSFWVITKLFSEVAAKFYIPISNVRASSPAFAIVRLFITAIVVDVISVFLVDTIYWCLVVGRFAWIRDAKFPFVN